MTLGDTSASRGMTVRGQGKVGEHRTLGGFCQVWHGENLISGESIRDLLKTPREHREARS